MNRKEFVKNLSFSCVGGTAVSALLQSCATTSYFAQNVLSNNTLSVRKAEFMKVENDKTIRRKYVLVKTDAYNFPICIFKIGEDSYSALLLECTHKGCELKPHGDYLSCPCHGSEFSNLGIVQNPPAEENLKTFQTRTDNENIYISL